MKIAVFSRNPKLYSTYPLNESVAISRSRDKLRSLQLLSRKGKDIAGTIVRFIEENAIAGRTPTRGQG